MSKKKESARLLLQNDLIEVEISSQNGSITGIKDKRIKKQYIKEKKNGRLFRREFHLQLFIWNESGLSELVWKSGDF